MLLNKEHKGLDYAFLVLFFSALFFTQLGDRPLATPDEGRYVEIPREMVVSKEYITPHLNGLKYFEKPPLVYWLESLPLKLGFKSEFFLRLPIALFAILGCLSVYAYAHRVYSRAAGYYSSLILGTSILYFSLAHLILLDLVLTVFLSMGLFSFIIGIKLPGGKERRAHLAISSACWACAVLTKGLIGIIIPLAIIGVWITALNKWKELGPLYLPTNLFIFLALTLPWHILVSLKNHEFFDFYFIREHFERYLTTIHRRMQPWWFFIPISTIGFFPWIFFLPRALKNFTSFKVKEWKIYDLEAFFIIWVLFIFVFFSCSSSKLIPYILPIFPPIAIILGRFFAYVIQGDQSTKIESLFYFFFSTALALSMPFLVEINGDKVLYDNLCPYFPYIKFYLIGGSGLFLVLSFLTPTKWRFWSLIGFHVAFILTLNTASPFIQKTSMKPLATYIRKTLSPNTGVVFYGMYAQDLPFYLDRTVKIINWSGELDWGKQIEPKNNIFLTSEDFQSFWSTQPSVCVISKEKAIPGIPFPPGSKFKRLYQENEYVLLCKNEVY